MIRDSEKFSRKTAVTPALLNGKSLAWRPVEMVLAYVAADDPKLAVMGRLTAVVFFGKNLFGVVRATFDGVCWERMPRSANDEGTLAEVVKGLHPAEADSMDIPGFPERGISGACQRCGAGDEEAADVIPTEVRVGVKLRFSATLCGTCSNALVSLVRPFLKEVPPDETGPRSIIV